MFQDTLVFALNTGKSLQVELFLTQSSCKSVYPVVGQYEGIVEQSYIVKVEDIKDMERFQRLLEVHEQACILHVNKHYQGFIYQREDNYVSGKYSLRIGELLEISEDSALKLNFFTKDAATNKYYTFAHNPEDFETIQRFVNSQ